jgi:hypothetical protein
MKDWPEFGSDEGKKALTLKEVLEHRSGMHSLDIAMSPEDMNPKGLKEDRLAKVIEK